MIFFTSDTHFGHRNVIPYCQRPFSSVEEMDADLIRRWNAIVKPDDVVYHLGDFAFSKPIEITRILSLLSGTKLLVLGNHDRRHTVTKWQKMGFTHVLGWDHMVKIGGLEFHLSHFPYKRFYDDGRDFSHHQIEDDGLPLLHGHVHCAWKKNKNMINVGVDQWAYAPVSENEILKIMEGLA